ncbi:MAG TPA: lipid-A-disaccharide synthase [Candidatus Acidoferrum sp.]|jgi:lipid-A-disaccharide synthase|nr:lipid-A-disaccharide synthase [Candidatus Acidoferrum sp.]
MPLIPLLLSAGEASGDMYAARLASALKQRLDVAIFGMGGPQMRAAGVEIVTDYSEVSVVGITEVLKRLPSLTRAMRRLVDEAQRRKPPLAILTDFPGFHLRLARKLRRRGVRNVYYICPQFWAWRPWRVNLVRRRFAEALCIFHFEEKFYADAGVQVKFIGHPLVGSVYATLTRELFCKKYGLEEGGRVITVLPGSRRGEIAHHLPILVEGLRTIRQRISGAPQIVVAVAPGLDAARLEKGFPADWHVRLISSDTYNALAAADLAIVSSGTATIETALLGKPMVVVYRLSSLTARLAKPLVKTRFFSMVNLIAGRAVVPELIQDDFTPQRLAAEAESLLFGSPSPNPRVSEMKRDLQEVQNLLGPPGAVERAADEIVRLLGSAASNAN